MTTVDIKHHPMLIGGCNVDSEHRMRIIDPSNETVVATVAQLGDLMESMIKRDCARKDASDVMSTRG